MSDPSETDVSGIVFEMEDQLRAAVDFAGILNDRLTQRWPISETEAASLGRLSGDVAHALSETLARWQAIFEEHRGF